MLLRGLAGRVQAARAKGRILVDQSPRRVEPAGRTTVFEDPGVEVGAPPRQRVDEPVVGAGVVALPVDHHRRRQHQATHPGGEHPRQQHRGGEIVVAAVGGRVGGVHAGTHHRSLMAHEVHAVEKRGQRLAVADIDAVTSLG